ncbi:MAG: RNB domain-containing ribonuclease, partial [Sedimentisphaerales bacterium]|nr:RNB domain-containing ribonuclease [Sedimentisphaerales bacterium]
MPEKFKHQILRFLRHRDYTPLKLGTLAKALSVSDEDHEQFKIAFEELRQGGRVVIGSKNLVSLPPLSGKITGIFRANAKGFGFVRPLEPNAHGDLFIAPGSTAEAMTGDTVTARVIERGKRDGQMRYAGEIIQILERGRNQFVGTLQYQNGFWFVKPDGTGATEHINVDDVTAKNAAENDKVVVEILSYATGKKLARGVIIEVLGKAGLYDAEIRSIIRQHHLPTEHDAACLEQARNAAAAFNPDVFTNRDDITNQIIITIDPPDAKDFDDAISLVKNSDGDWVLGVHIADVSAFIAMNSPLDIEAKDRGNSAYLPGKTLPMLPEILSNGICSLQPGQKRFVKSAYITYNLKGAVLGRDFANSVICSFERLTYEQADAILKGRV